MSDQIKIELVKFKCGMYGVRKTEGDSQPLFIDFEVWETFIDSGDDREPWNPRDYEGFDSYSMAELKEDAVEALNQIKERTKQLTDDAADMGEVIDVSQTS